MLLKQVSGVLGHIKIASNKPQTSANPDLCIYPRVPVRLMCVKIAILRSPVKILKLLNLEEQKATI